MASLKVLNLQQSAARAQVAGVAGSWKLVAGRAITLRPREDGSLRLTYGGIWLTGRDCPGDHFFETGQTVHLRAGQEVVIEPWNPAEMSSSSYFSWEPQVAARWSGSSRGRQAAPVLLGQDFDDLRAALAGLRASLGLALSAAGRLARGLALAGLSAAGSLVVRRARAAGA